MWVEPVGDFAAQAVVNTILSNAFPGDKIVGEEDAAELRQEANIGLRDRVVELANEALIGELGMGDNAQWGIGPGKQQTAEGLLRAIDLGNHGGGNTGSERKSYLCVLRFTTAPTLRILDARSYRWNKRFSSWGTVRCLFGIRLGR